MRRFVRFVVLIALAACARAPLRVTPSAPLAPVCPAEGCDEGSPRFAALRAPDACPSVGQAPCSGAPGPECTARALAVWADAQDEREVACVARMLTEACALGDAPGCGYAGRMTLDGRGAAQDTDAGLDMIVRACDGGVALACTAGMRWLAHPRNGQAIKDATLHERLDDQQACLTGSAERCMQIGLDLHFGRAPYPLDLARSAAAYQRGCDRGSGGACNNLGDAYEYGSGVPRDLSRAAALYERACRQGHVLGCSNLGHLIEHGEGETRDIPRARALYRSACGRGDVYGCLHVDLLSAEDAGAPSDPVRAVEHWQRACDARAARACAFLGLIYEDGPDGYARDEERSQKAMARACDLGSRLGCEWVRGHPGP